MSLITSRQYHVRLDDETGRYMVATGDPLKDWTVVGPLTKNAVLADADGNEVAVTSGGALLVRREGSPQALGASEVKTTVVTIGATAVNRATALTPSSGKRARIISVNIAVNSAAAVDRISVYFGLGVAYTTAISKAIHEVDVGANGSRSIVWPDGGGPIGEIDEVVSWIGETEADTLVRLTLVYREE